MPKDIFSQLKASRIIGKPGHFAKIDLSAERFPDGVSNVILQDYIKKLIESENGAITFGGYKERRALYDDYALFGGNRNWHLGIDIWAEAGTLVMAALDGKVHSFAYNAGAGNYGPTVILEHRSENEKFYTLYGHLDVASIENLEIEEIFTAGQALGRLGDESVNGGYVPHLHFQVIRDIEGYFGDYPGVCAEDELKHYLANCPDPNLLLRLI